MIYGFLRSIQDTSKPPSSFPKTEITTNSPIYGYLGTRAALQPLPSVYISIRIFLLTKESTFHI